MIISQSKTLLAVCLLLCLIIFSIDTRLPLGIAAGVPYIIVILVTLYIPSNKATIYFCLITSALTILGLFFSPFSGEEWKVLANRFLAVFAIISTTVIILLVKKSRKQLFQLNSQLENKIRQRSEQLEDAQASLIQASRMAVLGQLTATVSHELRNPLSVINASIYLLKNNITSNNDNTSKYIDRIEKNVTRCDYIIDELFNFTHNQSIKLTRQHLNELISNTSNEYRMPEQINFVQELELENLYFEVDAIKIKRAIINTLDNASQAIIHSLDKIATPTISIRAYMSDEKVIIEINDNGPGIPDNHLNKVFEPLYSTKSYGVGLGLPISQKIMEQHNGGIDIKSSISAGTCISLWLPGNLSTSNY